MDRSSRLAYFLGEMRRQMNGAVVGSMRFYGAEYGLNYGVSLPTIRALARAESGKDGNHKFARLLYQQEVRELRLAAFHLADSQSVEVGCELDFWARGVINSEVAEEAAFALLWRCQSVDQWLDGEDVLLQYCAVMAIAKRIERDEVAASLLLVRLHDKLIQLVENEPHILPKAVVALLDTAIKAGVDSELIELFLAALPSDSAVTHYLREEISWRLEFR